MTLFDSITFLFLGTNLPQKALVFAPHEPRMKGEQKPAQQEGSAKKNYTVPLDTEWKDLKSKQQQQQDTSWIKEVDFQHMKGYFDITFTKEEMEEDFLALFLHVPLEDQVTIKEYLTFIMKFINGTADVGSNMLTKVPEIYMSLHGFDKVMQSCVQSDTETVERISEKIALQMRAINNHLQEIQAVRNRHKQEKKSDADESAEERKKHAFQAPVRNWIAFAYHFFDVSNTNEESEKFFETIFNHCLLVTQVDIWVCAALTNAAMHHPKEHMWAPFRNACRRFYKLFSTLWSKCNGQGWDFCLLHITSKAFATSIQEIRVELTQEYNRLQMTVGITSQKIDEKTQLNDYTTEIISESEFTLLFEKLRVPKEDRFVSDSFSVLFAKCETKCLMDIVDGMRATRACLNIEVTYPLSIIPAECKHFLHLIQSLLRHFAMGTDVEELETEVHQHVKKFKSSVAIEHDETALVTMQKGLWMFPPLIWLKEIYNLFSIQEESVQVFCIHFANVLALSNNREEILECFRFFMTYKAHHGSPVWHAFDEICSNFFKECSDTGDILTRDATILVPFDKWISITLEEMKEAILTIQSISKESI